MKINSLSAIYAFFRYISTNETSLILLLSLFSIHNQQMYFLGKKIHIIGFFYFSDIHCGKAIPKQKLISQM